MRKLRHIQDLHKLNSIKLFVSSYTKDLISSHIHDSCDVQFTSNIDSGTAYSQL